MKCNLTFFFHLPRSTKSENRISSDLHQAYTGVGLENAQLSILPSFRTVILDMGLINFLNGPRVDPSKIGGL